MTRALAVFVLLAACGGREDAGDGPAPQAATATASATEHAEPAEPVPTGLVAAVGELCGIRKLPAAEQGAASEAWAKRHPDANTLNYLRVRGDKRAIARIEAAFRKAQAAGTCPSDEEVERGE